MDEINQQNYKVVYDEQGNIITDGSNNVLMSNINSGEIYYVELTENVRTMFGFEEQTVMEPSIEKQVKKKWDRNATLMLIAEMKAKEKDFQSTTIRNDIVYTKITEALQRNGYNFSSVQVKDRCKYLKMRYCKKKDNMKVTSSGAATITFEFFEEMDEIFGKKANVTPVTIASSSKPSCTNDEQGSINCDETVLEDVEPENSKKRKRHSKDSITERHHREKLEVQQRAIDTYEKMMQKLIDKL